MIPKIIHHIAPNKRTTWHPVWQKCYESWLKEYPDPEYKHMLWNDTWDLDNLVKFHLPQHYPRFSHIKRHIVKIDFCKAVMVYVYGGMYVDMDFFCFENFYKDLKKQVILSESSYNHSETIQNAIFGAVKHHPFTMSYINDMMKNIKEMKDPGGDEYVLNVVGPRALSKSYSNQRNNFSGQFQVLPCAMYNPHLDTITKHVKNPSTTHSIKCAHFMTGIWGRDYLRDPDRAREIYEDWRGIHIDDL